MGRDPAGDIAELAPLQIGFLTFVVAPLFISLNAATEGTLARSVDSLARNVACWEKLKEREEPVDEAIEDELQEERVHRWEELVNSEAHGGVIGT
jgi:hypothetical protein